MHDKDKSLDSTDILTHTDCVQRKNVRSWCIHGASYASVVKERRLTCAEAVRTTKYIADNRVNIFKQFVPRSVRWSLFFPRNTKVGV